MNKLALCLALLSAGDTLAQNFHAVPANSRGNTVLLTISNESQTRETRDVEVVASSRSPGVTFTSDRASVSKIPARGVATVAFRFDVARGASLNKPDTLAFLGRDNRGAAWKKEIVVMYTPPETFDLEQNFPNPFNPSTVIRYQLPVASRVSLKVYDVLGREVRSLVDGQQGGGFYEIAFDAHELATGSYFCRLAAEPVQGRSFVSSQRMILVK